MTYKGHIIEVSGNKEGLSVEGHPLASFACKLNPPELAVYPTEPSYTKIVGALEWKHLRGYSSYDLYFEFKRRKAKDRVVSNGPQGGLDVTFKSSGSTWISNKLDRLKQEGISISDINERCIEAGLPELYKPKIYYKGVSRSKWGWFIPAGFAGAIMYLSNHYSSYINLHYFLNDLVDIKVYPLWASVYLGSIKASKRVEVAQKLDKYLSTKTANFVQISTLRPSSEPKAGQEKPLVEDTKGPQALIPLEEVAPKKNLTTPPPESLEEKRKPAVDSSIKTRVSLPPLATGHACFGCMFFNAQSVVCEYEPKPFTVLNRTRVCGNFTKA